MRSSVITTRGCLRKVDRFRTRKVARAAGGGRGRSRRQREYEHATGTGSRGAMRTRRGTRCIGLVAVNGLSAARLLRQGRGGHRVYRRRKGGKSRGRGGGTRPASPCPTIRTGGATSVAWCFDAGR